MNKKTDSSKNYLTEEKFEERMQLSDEKFEKRMQLSDEKFEKRMQLSDEKFEKRMQLSDEEFEKKMQISEEKLEKKIKIIDRRMESFEKNFTKIIINLQKHLDTQVQWHADRINEDLTKKITIFKDQMLTTFDPLLKELETRQQEREIASYQSQKIHTKLDNHENRISALEHA